MRIASSAASPARISARQESAPGLRDLARAFGLSSPVSLGRLDPDTCSLRTSQVCLFTMQCDELSESFPDSGMWGYGEVYELQSSAPVICESESSLWPGVRADPNPGERLDQTGGKSLDVRARHWPTARAEDSESCGNHPGAMDSLTGATKNWPTPVRNDAEKRGDFDTDRSPCLAASAMTWPTPEAASGGRQSGSFAQKSCLNEDGTPRHPSLAQTALMWPTPKTVTGGPGYITSIGPDGGKQQVDLAAIAMLWATPHTNCTTGAGTQGRDGGENLQTQIDHWTTPQAHDGMGGPRTAEQLELARATNKGGNCNLSTDAVIWQTPGTDSFRSRGGDRKDEMGLDQMARCHSSHPAPQIPDGNKSLIIVQTWPRRLAAALGRVLLSF